MVEVNAGHRRPAKVLSLRHIPELRSWQQLPSGEVRLGATVTYTDMLDPALAQLLPALAHAARTVGSPQIRNAGTIGGNLATASPAGDTLPVLAALDAVVEVASALGARDIPVSAFITGPKRNALSRGELIVAVRLPLLDGHQEFRKIGVRNAMVIAVASLALAVDRTTRTVRCALGSVGPGPIRATEAEEWLAGAIDWDLERRRRRERGRGGQWHADRRPGVLRAPRGGRRPAHRRPPRHRRLPPPRRRRAGPAGRNPGVRPRPRRRRPRRRRRPSRRRPCWRRRGAAP